MLQQFRDLDPTKLYCNIHGGAQVPRNKFNLAIMALATEANVSEEAFDVEGDELDNRFKLAFKGPSAKARALQFYQSPQLGKGRWKVQKCLDAEGTDNQFYIAPDKNPSMVKRELLCKDLRGILEGMVGGKPIFIRKATSTLLVDRLVLCSVVVPDEVSAHIAWNHAKRIQLSLDEAAIATAFRGVVEGDKYS